MHYANIISVEFDRPIRFDQEGDEVYQKGFTMVIGCNTTNIVRACELACSAASAEARKITKAYHIEKIEIEKIEPEHWDDDILKQIKDFTKELYYKSSKIFFTAPQA